LARFEGLRAANRDAYGGKLQRELRGNLDAWRWFVDDCLAGAAECVDDYPSEARKRLRIQGLLVDGERGGVAMTDETRELARLDDDLRGVFDSDPRAFCGPRGEADRYPESQYWWLYGRPRRADV
jgi:hypothetical protein